MTAAGLARPAGGDTGPGEGDERDRVGTLADEILADERYQTALPDAPGAMVPGAMLGGLGFVLWVVLIVGAAVAVLVVIALVIGALRRPGEAAEVDDDDDGAARPGGGGLLPSARAAAAAGRLDEAIHLLLLHAIDRLARRTRCHPEMAETTRELVGRMPLEGEPRQALAALVRDVELIHFGGRPATVERFDACALAYRRAVGEEAP